MALTLSGHKKDPASNLKKLPAGSLICSRSKLLLHKLSFDVDGDFLAYQPAASL